MEKIVVIEQRGDESQNDSLAQTLGKEPNVGFGPTSIHLLDLNLHPPVLLELQTEVVAEKLKRKVLKDEVTSEKIKRQTMKNALKYLIQLQGVELPLEIVAE
ncbi:hypothetical protein AHAS_Ahas08G0174000 [Arachis hypogaea]